jgi:hypothetical protein
LAAAARHDLLKESAPKIGNAAKKKIEKSADMSSNPASWQSEYENDEIHFESTLNFVKLKMQELPIICATFGNVDTTELDSHHHEGDMISKRGHARPPDSSRRDNRHRASLLFSEKDQQAMARMKTAVVCHLFHKMCALFKEMPHLAAISEVMESLENEILNLIYVEPINNPHEKTKSMHKGRSAAAFSSTGSIPTTLPHHQEHQHRPGTTSPIGVKPTPPNPPRRLQWFHSKTPYHIDNVVLKNQTLLSEKQNQSQTKFENKLMTNMDSIGTRIAMRLISTSARCFRAWTEYVKESKSRQSRFQHLTNIKARMGISNRMVFHSWVVFTLAQKLEKVKAVEEASSLLERQLNASELSRDLFREREASAQVELMLSKKQLQQFEAKHKIGGGGGGGSPVMAQSLQKIIGSFMQLGELFLKRLATEHRDSKCTAGSFYLLDTIVHHDDAFEQKARRGSILGLVHHVQEEAADASDQSLGTVVEGGVVRTDTVSSKNGQLQQKSLVPKEAPSAATQEKYAIAIAHFNSKFPKLKATPMDVLLLRWVNYHLSNALSPGYKLLKFRRRVENFGTDMKDGECLAVLLNQLDPIKAPKTIALEKDPDKRATMVFEAIKEINQGTANGSFFAPSHIRMGNAPVLVGVISMLFCANGGIPTIDEQCREEDDNAIELLNSHWAEAKKTMRMLIAKFKSSNWTDLQLQEAEGEYTYAEQQVLQALTAMCKKNDQVRKLSASSSNGLIALQQKAVLYLGSLFQANIAGKKPDVVDEKELRLRQTFNISQQRVQAVMMEYKVDNRDQQMHSRRTKTFTRAGDDVTSSEGSGAISLGSYSAGTGKKKKRGSIAVGFECLDLQGLLQTHVMDIHRIFCHYSAADDDSKDDTSTMSQSEWMILMKDIKIFDTRLRQVQAVKIFLEADHNNTNVMMESASPSPALSSRLLPASVELLSSPSPGATKRALLGSPGQGTRSILPQKLSPQGGENGADASVDMNNPDGELVPHEFLEAIVRLACRKFSTGNLGLMQRVRLILEKHLLPFACRAEPNLFNSIVCKEEVRAVMQANSPALIRIYQYYSSQNIHKSASSKGTMDYQDLIKFCRDCSLIEGLLTEAAVNRIFQLIQQVDGGDVDQADDTAGGAARDTERNNEETDAVGEAATPTAAPASVNNELVYRSTIVSSCLLLPTCLLPTPLSFISIFVFCPIVLFVLPLSILI